MKILRRISRNLRSSILVTFSALLLFSFVLVGFAFSVAARQYIHRRANDALIDAMNFHWVSPSFDPDIFISHVIAQGNEDTIFHHNLRHFYVNSEYELEGISPVAYNVVRDIIGVLKSEETDLSRMQPQRIRVGATIYYVAAAVTMVRPPETYTIYYIDTTDLQRFTANINLRIVGLVAMIWFASMLMSTYLAGSLAKPLKSLSKFAGQIGQGDFTPNPVSFANEEL